jgi:MFS family permease
MRPGMLAAASTAVAIGAGALYAGPVFRAALVADLGWSNELAAGAFAIGYLAAGATPVVSGVVADRFGASRLLVVGLLLSALGLFGAALTTTPWHWYLAAGVGLSVAYYLIHVGGTLIATAGTARGTAVGVAIGLGVGLGLAAGPVLAQVALDARGWRDALTGFGAGTLVVAVLIAWLTRRAASSGEKRSIDRRHQGAPSDVRHSVRDPDDTTGRASLNGAAGFRRKTLAGFFLGNVLLAVFDEAVYQHGYSLAVARGLTVQDGAVLLGLISLALTLGMLLGGPLSDLVGRRRVLVGAAATVLVALLGLAGASSEALRTWGGDLRARPRRQHRRPVGSLGRRLRRAGPGPSSRHRRDRISCGRGADDLAGGSLARRRRRLRDALSDGCHRGRPLGGPGRRADRPERGCAPREQPARHLPRRACPGVSRRRSRSRSRRS